jgi:hypothetical protein
MTNGREKSDLAIVATKPANNDGRPSAESVERRAGAEGNAGRDRTRRTQDRESVSQGLTAYGTLHGHGRRNGSPRSSTTSLPTCCGRRPSLSSDGRPLAWTG